MPKESITYTTTKEAINEARVIQTKIGRVQSKTIGLDGLTAREQKKQLRDSSIQIAGTDMLTGENEVWVVTPQLSTNDPKILERAKRTLRAVGKKAISRAEAMGLLSSNEADQRRSEMGMGYGIFARVQSTPGLLKGKIAPRRQEIEVASSRFTAPESKRFIMPAPARAVAVAGVVVVGSSTLWGCKKIDQEPVPTPRPVDSATSTEIAPVPTSDVEMFEIISETVLEEEAVMRNEPLPEAFSRFIADIQNRPDLNDQDAKFGAFGILLETSEGQRLYPFFTVEAQNEQGRSFIAQVVALQNGTQIEYKAVSLVPMELEDGSGEKHLTLSIIRDPRTDVELTEPLVMLSFPYSANEWMAMEETDRKAVDAWFSPFGEALVEEDSVNIGVLAALVPAATPSAEMVREGTVSEGDPAIFANLPGTITVISSAEISLGEEALNIAWIKDEERQELGEIWTGESEDLISGLVDENGLYKVEVGTGGEWSVPSVGKVNLREGVAIDVNINDRSGDVGLWLRASTFDTGENFRRIALDLSGDSIAAFIFDGSENPENSEEPVMVEQLGRIPSNGEFQVQLVPTGNGINMVILGRNGNTIGEMQIPRDMFPYGFVDVQLAVSPGASMSFEKLGGVRPRESTDIYSMIAWMIDGRWELAEARQESDGSWWASLGGEWTEVVSVDGTVRIPGVDLVGNIDPEQLAGLLEGKEQAELELALDQTPERSKIVNKDGVWVGENPEGEEFSIPNSIKEGVWLGSQPEGIREVSYFEKHYGEWYGIDNYERAVSRKVREEWEKFARPVVTVGFGLSSPETISRYTDNELDPAEEKRFFQGTGELVNYGLLFDEEIVLASGSSVVESYYSGIFRGSLEEIRDGSINWYLVVEFPFKYRRTFLKTRVPGNYHVYSSDRFSGLELIPADTLNIEERYRSESILTQQFFDKLSSDKAIGQQIVVRFLYIDNRPYTSFPPEYLNNLKVLHDGLDGEGLEEGIPQGVIFIKTWVNESLFSN